MKKKIKTIINIVKTIINVVYWVVIGILWCVTIFDFVCMIASLFADSPQTKTTGNVETVGSLCYGNEPENCEKTIWSRDWWFSDWSLTDNPIIEISIFGSLAIENGIASIFGDGYTKEEWEEKINSFKCPSRVSRRIPCCKCQ